jgi:CRP-like cAMP-binding protein
MGRTPNCLSKSRFAEIGIWYPNWNMIGALPETQVYPGGMELLRQDHPVSSVHVIEKGMVKLVHLRADGRTVIAGMRTSGSLLGAAEAILGASSLTTAVAVVPTSTRRISAKTFTALLMNNPTFSACVANTLGHETYMETIHAIELAACPARERLIRFLSELMGNASSTDPSQPLKLRLPLKHWELAQWLAVTPAYLCALFKQLICEGMIVRRNGRIVIPDRNRWHGEARRV